MGKNGGRRFGVIHATWRRFQVKWGRSATL